MARGDWHRTKDLVTKGADWIIAEMKKSGLRGRGGAGISFGSQVEFYAKGMSHLVASHQMLYMCSSCVNSLSRTTAI